MNFKILSFVAAISFVACTHTMFLFQTPFLSKFSLRDLIERNKAVSGLKCGEGPGGGGGGSANSVFAGGGKSSYFSKSEGLSCKLSDDREFDEAGLMAALEQTIEKDLKDASARIIEHKAVDAGGFYFDYELKDITGKIEISGRKSPGNYYSLDAKIQEKSGDAK